MGNAMHSICEASADVVNEAGCFGVCARLRKIKIKIDIISFIVYTLTVKS